MIWQQEPSSEGTQWALHHSDDGSAGGDKAKPMNPAVYNVLRDVGCSIVLIVAGRVQSGEFMWPESNDRFIFVLIGVCKVYFGQYFNVLGVTYANALTSSICPFGAWSRWKCRSGLRVMPAGRRFRDNSMSTLVIGPPNG